MESSTKLILTIFVIVAALSLPSISATDFIVGDATGWTTAFDYQKWAQGKEFRVGDNLIFRYPQGVHNVNKVNATGFQQCLVSSPADALTTGNDVITLKAEGPKWYVCGVGKHCELGKQKLAINVLLPASLTSSAPAPSPAASSAAAHRSMSYTIYGAMLMIVATILAITTA